MQQQQQAAAAAPAQQPRLQMPQRPPQGTSNWLPVPVGAFHVVTRLYLPRREALEGHYVLPAVERID